MRNSGFAPRRRQGGFIQGAILFALVIIAVVVAAFSLANRDSQSSADSEQARVNASFVLKVGNDLQTGINRAIADGFNPAQLADDMIFNNGPSDGTTLNLFEENLKYMVRPQFPNTALIDGATQPFADAETNEVAWAVQAITGAGDAAQDEAIITVSGLKEDVCKRVNVTANGVLVSAPLPEEVGGEDGDWREGCYASGTDFIYFRVVATDVRPKA